MKDQINTIREALKFGAAATNAEITEALTALAQLEAMVGAHDHIDMNALRVSHCKDAAIAPHLQEEARRRHQEAMREALLDARSLLHDGRRQDKALTALAQIEAMVGEQEPVAYAIFAENGNIRLWSTESQHVKRIAQEKGLSLVTLYAAPVAQQHETVTNDEQARAYMDARLWEFIDMAGMWPKAKPDPRIWAHVMVYAPVAQQQEPVAWAMPKGDGTFIDVITPAEHARDEGSYTVPLFAHPVAQQPQARPDFTDEWAGYLKDGETPFERFLRERKDVQSVLKLYQRALEENERLKAQQPQAEPDIHEAQGQIEFLDKKNNALSAAIRKVMARLADLLDEDQFKEIEEIVSFAGVQPQAEAVPLTHVLVPVDEPTDEMVDAACAAVDGLCRVDFVRAYVAAFAHLKAGYRDESYWCGWNAAIKFQQAEAVPVVDRVYEAAKRLVDHADFQLGGVLSAKSKARDIPSNAASKVKARHLASLRDALAKAPQQAEAVPPDVVRDAERYRWLRVCNLSKFDFVQFAFDLGDEHLDNAIDIAIAQQKGANHE